MLRYLNKANQEEAENGGTARGNGRGDEQRKKFV
jgi:hypothetical protein